MAKRRVTMAEARKIYTQAGGNFFHKETVNFWGTKIVSGLYANRCFITSEYDFSGEYHFFNVRQYSEDYKSIRTVSEFNKLTTKQQAVDFVHNPNRWVNSHF